ncbi:GGDEF domain-containing protein [Halioxenophilus aromaticivorans]|uniref:diguanylate cyclase n=1 Tax=Halioxenophilus aromaticivorans TaxID=1306992 RepID=A0AAV3U865_9ALTE
MTSNWREKYLQALEDQENAEKRSTKQIQHLRACLQSMAGAAMGLDPELDELLEPLLDQQSARPVKSDQIVVAANKVRDRKPTREAVSKDSLTAMVFALLDLNPDVEVTKKLKHYQKLLPQRVKNHHAYPQLLKEIVTLHDQVLRSVITKKPGKLAKLFGASPTLDIEHSQAGEVEPLIGDESGGGEEASAGEEMPALVDKANDSSLAREPASPAAEPVAPVSSQQQVEAGFASIQAKIQFILQELAQSAEVDSGVKEQFVEAKNKLEEGLNWYEMIAMLEQVRNLFASMQKTANDQFAGYLKEVDSTLIAIKQNWAELIDGQLRQVAHHQKVKKQLQSQESQLLLEVEKTTELDALKASVNNHVRDLNATISLVSTAEDQAVSSSQVMQAMQTQLDELQAKNDILQQELENQKHKATHDALTQLPNRAAYGQRAQEELNRWQRYQRPLSVAVVDVDHFKRFNDTYGHQAGDRVLKILGKLLRDKLRSVDFVARYGGEEFVMLLPETACEDAKVALDKLRVSLSKTQYKFKDEPVTITASFGVTQFTEGDSVETAFERADQALYNAKQEGRNCVSAL